QLALANLVLHHQLVIDDRTARRPKLRMTDHLLWVALAKVWTGWRQALVIVSPDTVVRWQRHRLPEYWAKLSGRPTGPPCGHAEIRGLVARMAAANPLWGAPQGSAHGATEPVAESLRRASHRLGPARGSGSSWAKSTYAAFSPATSTTTTELALISP